MKTSTGWMLTFQVMDLKHKEIFYRVGPTGEYRNTGQTTVINRYSGAPYPNYTVTLPLTQKPATIFVKYTDGDGGEHGPFELPFAPRKEAIRSAKSILNMTRTSWVSLSASGDKVLVHFTHLICYRDGLKEVRYSLGKPTPEKTFPLPPPDPGNRIFPNTKTYIEAPGDTRAVYVQLTYGDGAKSEVAEFRLQ
jgi:hypothetical protein